MTLLELKNFLSLTLPPSFYLHFFNRSIGILSNAGIFICGIKNSTLKPNEILITFEQYEMEDEVKIKEYLNTIGTLEFKIIDIRFKPVYIFKLKEEYEY